MRIIHRATIAAALSACVVAALLAMPGRAAAQDAGPQSSAPSQDSAGQSYSVTNAYRVQRILADGTRVVLGDGTEWEVYLPDRPAVDRWRRGDVLVVRQAGVSQGEYDYTLVNGRTRDRVTARFGGEAPARR